MTLVHVIQGVSRRLLLGRPRRVVVLATTPFAPSCPQPTVGLAPRRRTLHGRGNGNNGTTRIHAGCLSHTTLCLEQQQHWTCRERMPSGAMRAIHSSSLYCQDDRRQGQGPSWTSPNKQRKLEKARTELREKCLYVEAVLPRGQMDVPTWNFCLDAVERLAKSNDNNDDPKRSAENVQQAQRLLQRCIQEVQSRSSPTNVDKNNNDDYDAPATTTTTSTPPFVLTARPFIHVLRAWAATQQPEALDHCRALFEQMEHLHQSNSGSSCCFPNPHQGHVYSAILYACGQSKHANARQIADEWMQVFVHNFDSHQQQSSSSLDNKNDHGDDNNNESPRQHLPVEIYNQIILVHASRAAQEYGAAAAAEDWLVHLSQLHTQGGPPPTTDSFNRVLRAWATSPEAAAVDRAQVILNLMLQLQHDHPVVQPNVTTFATIILACARHNQPNQAETLWRETVQYFQKQQQGPGRWGMVNLSPCLNATTMAWANSGLPEAVEQIETILQEWFTTAKQQEEDLGIVAKSTAESMAHLLTTLVQQDAVPAADRRLRQFWDNHVKLGHPLPFAGALHFVITSYQQKLHSDPPNPGAAQLATKLLLDAVDLKKKHQSMKRPDAASFNVCLQMCLEDYPNTKPLVMNLLDAAESMRRSTVYTYKLVINALCKEGTTDSALQALRILERLIQRDADRRSWVELGKQDVGIFTAVVGALAAAPDLESANACLDIFRYIQSSQKWRPSTRMYTSVIFNLRKMGKEGRQRAYELFQEMVQAEKDPGSYVKLDSFVFLTVLRVLVGENEVSTARASLEVLMTMLRMWDNGRKDLIPNQLCLDVCLRTVALSGDSEMLRLGTKLFEEIQRRHDRGMLSVLPSKDVVEMLRHKAH